MTWPYVKGRSDAEKDHTFNVQPVLDQSPRAHHGQRAAAGRRPMSGGVRAAPRAAQAPLRPMSASGLLTASPRVQRTAPSRPAWDAPAPSEAGSAIGDEMAVAVPPPRALSDPALRAIAEREECLQAITMQLQMVRRVRGQSGRLSGRILELFQWRIAKCIAALRLATLRVVEAAVTWRASDPDSSSSSSAPEPMVYYGVNYLLKILTDLCWLPLPGASDPLLLRWFGREAHWWRPPYRHAYPPHVMHNGTRQGILPPFPLDLLSAPPEGEVTQGLLTAMRQAEVVLKAESDRYGFAPSDGMQPPPHSIELAREMEIIMYGIAGAYDQVLSKILRAHTAAVTEQNNAAVVLQRAARGKADARTERIHERLAERRRSDASLR